MKLICKTCFGSHLYGTATPTSDIDVRGVFFPSKRDILLGRIPRTNKDNNVSTEDYELYSLHHFVKLACEGQTLAFDMLWTPASQVTLGEAGYIWNEICALRHKFLSKRMKAFTGYARAQAAKYSLKGERLNKLQMFIDVLGSIDDHMVLQHIWSKLPKDDVRINAQGVNELQICGKWFSANTQVRYVYESIDSIMARYGTRATTAASDGGVDWKALSHAVRVSLELHELLTTRQIAFPLASAELLLKIKRGELSLETVQDYLDEILLSVEELTDKSDLPETVDRDYWENWLASVVEEEIFSK